MSEVVESVEAVEAVPADTNPFDNPANFTEQNTDYMEPVSDSRGGVLDNDIESLRTDENLKILEQIPSRLAEIDNAYWEMAGLMARVYNDHLYQLHEYKTFKDYCNKELSIEKRRAYYWVKMYNYFTKSLKSILADKPELYEMYLTKAKTIGWSKASIIASANVINTENADEMYQKIGFDTSTREEPSYRAIGEVLKKEKDEIPEEVKRDMADNNEIKMIPFRTSLTEAQDMDVEAAMKIAAGMAKDGAKKGTLLSWICRDFASHNGAAAGAETKNFAIKRLEDLLGVHLVAFDTDGNKVYDGSKQEDTAQEAAPIQ